jgi:ABC-type nitrate/sulfonate/bicarbonate transport system substrate-binding protein
LSDEVNPLKRKPLILGGVPEHFNLPLHLAIEGGDFSNQGIELEYLDVPGGTGAMTRRLRDSELDNAIVLAEGGVSALLKGNPSRIVKTYVQSPLIWGIHVAVDSDIRDIDQIQGTRYAISRFGSGSHLMAIVDASERDWPTTDMKFEKVGNLTGARAALADGTADTFFWERFTTAPFVQSGEFRLVGERRTLWPAFIICVRERTLNERADEIKKVLEIINRRCAELMSDENACELISKRYKLRLSDVEEWFGQTRWSTDFEKPTEAIEHIKSYLLKLGIVSEQQAAAKELWYSFSELTESEPS